MPNEFSSPDETNNLMDKRVGKDRRQKIKPRFDDEDDQDAGAEQRRRDKKDRRGASRTHRSLHNDDD